MNGQSDTGSWSSNDTAVNYSGSGGLSPLGSGTLNSGSGSFPFTCPSSQGTLTFTSATGKSGSFNCTLNVGGTGDTTKPTVSITSPLNGAKVLRNTSITITASASDNKGVTKVEFRVDGILKCTDTVAPYTCNWVTPLLAGQTRKLGAKAYDAAGNVGTSATVSVTTK